MSNQREEEEKKKWHIDRIKTLIEGDVEKFESERARFRSRIEVVESDLTASMNAYLSAASVAASVILGLYSANILKDYMLPLLAVDVAFGVVVFAVFNNRKKTAHDLILNMDSGYFLAADKLADLHRLFIHKTYCIDKIDEDRIYFFWLYLTVASLAVRVYLIDIFDDMSKSQVFESWKDRLEAYRDIQVILVKKAKRYHKDPKAPWNSGRDKDKYKDDLDELNPYIKEFLKYDETKEGRAIEIEEITSLKDYIRKQGEEDKRDYLE